MSNDLKLHRPWLVAVWPGMGSVALAAGYYLMAKLGMQAFAEFSARELFDVEHVEVKNGLIGAGRMPRSRLFVWNDPARARDIVLFIGEAQPPLGKHAFCQKLIEYAQQLGVERVFTFAAMATPAPRTTLARVRRRDQRGKPGRAQAAGVDAPGRRPNRRPQRRAVG
ncbi:MAG TPA: PAC2 family protein, partial [Pirellulales bacterium]|nr:PAC2 family protein [Pirellulales bacterium]